MAGGLGLSQLLTLFMTPLIYLYLDSLRKLAGAPSWNARNRPRGCRDHGGRPGSGLPSRLFSIGRHINSRIEGGTANHTLLSHRPPRIKVNGNPGEK
jgi:hypothetical protein